MTEATAAWVAAGLAGLSGRPDGPPLLPPEATVSAIDDLVAAAPVADPLALVGERAALGGLTRQGARSCGGSSRLLTAADGWLAVSLPRPEDVEAVPAWLELGTDPSDPWVEVGAAVRERPVAGLVERAALLGLPVAAVAEPAETPPEPVVRHRLGDRPPTSRPVVVDLSSLWAGPLCSHLLQREGARVVKVESVHRPDGGRADPSGLFDLLNHGKASVALDLRSREGVDRLRRLLAAADVVIEGSRPRALRQLGIAPCGPAVWVSLTAHGREGAAGDRVGFGDDAAASGGLVTADAGGPCFLADAVADPLAGIAAATAVRSALAEGGTWLLDVALSRVAASVARPGPSRPHAAPVPPPQARAPEGRAPDLGADTAAVLAELT